MTVAFTSNFVALYVPSAFSVLYCPTSCDGVSFNVISAASV